MERTVILCVLMMAWWIKAGAVRLAGGDVSLLPEYEEAGANYYDPEGRPIASLLLWLHDEGMNAMRVRLFVNPSDYTGPDADPNACQTMEYILPLCRQICDAGMELMLDFHYSDTWADPARQFTPAAWGTMDDEALARQVYDYTRRSLLTLKEEGIVPAYIQPGNEISYGMLWGAPGTPDELLKKTLMGSDANWDRLGLLLRHAVSACREVCPDAGIVIHTERTASPDEQRNFYRQMERLGIDFDIIGLSYYPYFHGPLSSLDAAITELETDFPAKRIMVVETGYAYAWEVPGTSCAVDYPYTQEGQAQFASGLVEMLEQHPAVNGLFWWWLEYNACGTMLSGWYNAPLFDSRNGRATPALRIIASFAERDTPDGVAGFASADRRPSVFYDLSGRPMPHPRPGTLCIDSSGRRLLLR